MEYSTLFLYIFYLTASATALYTEVRKLSGNEYRENYRLPISTSNTSLALNGKKTLFKWNAVGNYSVLSMRKPSNLTETNTEQNKRIIKKGRLKLSEVGNNNNNTELALKKHRKKRLKRKRDDKRNNKKIRRVKNKKNKFDRKRNNIKKSKTMDDGNNGTNNQNTVQRYMTEIHTENSALSEDPNRYGSQIGNLHSNEVTNRNDNNNNEIAQFQYHLPFRLKWQALALRNFTSDNNECLLNNGGCEGLCINTPRSYRCHCPQGFHLDINRKRCIDINECASRNGHGPCQGECTNTWGSYRCGCETIRGTKLADDNRTCKLIDKCSVNKCSHQCISTRTGAFCACPQGYILADDWATCQLIDLS